jgi:hypothetical protein
LTLGVGVTLFSIYFWGLYENYGLIGDSKLPYMLLGLCRSIQEVMVSKKNNKI